MKSAGSNIDVLVTGPSVEAVGGIQTHVANLMHAFVADTTSIDITHLETSSGLHKAESLGRKILRTAGLLVPFLRLARNSDVVHINSSFATVPLLRDYIYCLLSLALGRPYIVQFHGGLARDTRVLASRRARRFAEWILGRAAAILILSSVQRESLLACVPGIACKVIPNFVAVPDGPIYRPQTGPMRFLFLGRVDLSKGIAEIVQAARSLSGEGLELEVNICGDGPGVEWLVEALEKGDSSVVRFLGRVEGEQKQRVLAEHNVLLLPSRHREGLPYGVLEALAYSMPVIATKVGALPDIIQHGETGYLLGESIESTLEDAMRSLILNPAEAARMSVNAYQVALGNYSFAKLRETFVDIYSASCRVTEC